LTRRLGVSRHRHRCLQGAQRQ